jgi:hypothetical protein
VTIEDVDAIVEKPAEAVKTEKSVAWQWLTLGVMVGAMIGIHLKK